MSMYGLVFGENEQSDLILATLGLKKDDIGRFRDVYVTDNEIAVYTRMGGGNRGCWEETLDDPGARLGCQCPSCKNMRLLLHECYLRDVDDDFDSTYATYYFKFPEAFAEGLKAIQNNEPWNPDKRWHDAIEALHRKRGK